MWGDRRKGRPFMKALMNGVAPIFPEPSEGAFRETRSAITYASVAALAAELGLSEKSTRNALRRGEIPHIRVGRRFILPKTAIAEWLRTAGQNITASS